ncbi:MAG: hypothetical protein KAJ14_05755, partial [Candidatus Omnitrophica bacterium]|nr:hypothetical protein [Candidatus Omnitrophota bacterium]
LILRFGLSGNKLDTLKDTLSFISFGENVSYQNLSLQQKELLDNLKFVEVKVTDAEGEIYYSYVVKGDKRGRTVFILTDKTLTVNTEFFGYETMPKSGYLKDLKTGQSWKIDNKDMNDATIEIEGTDYYLPEDTKNWHRVLFSNPKTNESMFRWFRNLDPVGGRYIFEEKGYFTFKEDSLKPEVEWSVLSRQNIGNWSHVKEIALDWVVEEFDFRLGECVESERGFAYELIDTQDASQFGISDWHSALLNFDPEQYLTMEEQEELITLIDKGDKMRKVVTLNAKGVEEVKFYPLSPMKDAAIEVKDTVILIHLGWTSDDKGSFYRKTLIVDKQGAGVKSVVVATSEFREWDEIITPEIILAYKEMLGRDFEVDFNWYRKMYGIRDEQLREIKEIGFMLDGTTDEAVQYSSQEKLPIYHYILAKDITAKVLCVMVPVGGNMNKTIINMWFVSTEAPFGLVPSTIAFDGNDVSLKTYANNISVIDWYNQRLNQVENIKISELTQDNYKDAFVYRVKILDGDHLLREEVVLPSEKLIQQMYEYQKINLGNVIPVTRGYESIQHNYSFPYEVPEFGFETKEKYRTKEWMAVNYGSKEIVHLVKEKEGT